MAFWGAQVTPNVRYKFIIPDFKYLRISEIALGSGQRPENVSVMVKYNHQEYVAETLSSDHSRKIVLDLLFKQEFEVFHDWKDGCVFLCGEYIQFPFIRDDHYYGFGKELYIHNLVKAEKHKNSLLVKNLSLHTTEHCLKKYFGMFGYVKEVHLNYRKDKTYTMTALVKMKSFDSIEKIRRTPRHILHKKCLDIVKYMGKRALEDEFYKGRYRLIIKGLKFLGPSDYIRDNTEAGNHFNKILADAFDDLACTSVRLERVGYLYSGGAELMFDHGEDESRVLQRAKDVLHCEASWKDTYGDV